VSRQRPEGIALADTSSLNSSHVPRRREAGATSIGYPTGPRVKIRATAPRASESRPCRRRRRRVREPCGSLAGCVHEFCVRPGILRSVQYSEISTRSAPRPTRPVSHSHHNLPGGVNDTVDDSTGMASRTSTASPRENFDVELRYGNSDQFAGRRGAEDHATSSRRPTAPPVAGVRDELAGELVTLVVTHPCSLLRHELRQFCRSRGCTNN